MSEALHTVALSTLAEITMGQSPESAIVSETERGLPFLQGCAEFGERHPSTRLWCSPPLRVAKKGSVLVSVRAPVGTTNLADQDYCIGRGLGAVRAKDGVSNGVFLLNAIEHNVGFLHQRSQGSTFSAIGSRELASFPVPDLTSDQQRRIAEILGTVDEVIEQTEALIAKQQQVKAGLMHDLFTRGVTATGQLRPPPAEAPHLYHPSPLGPIPKEWTVEHLRDKALAGKAHLKTGPFGSSLKGEHWVQNGHPVITIGALGEGELIASELLFVSSETAARLHDYQLTPGDVVFSRVADVGRSAVIEPEHDRWIMSSNLMRISLNSRLVEPSYLQAQFASDSRLKAQIRTTVNSGGRDVANGQVLNRLLFAWPPHNEQVLAIERMHNLETVRRSLIQQAAKLRQQKQGLMHDLLTARVPVQA